MGGSVRASLRNARAHAVDDHAQAHAHAHGQTLARVELRIVFETILRRLPALRLAVPADALRFKDDMQIYGVHALPVAW